MSKMLLPMELYHAARETCVRLYVANGGNVKDKWVIRPYPGTAAIAVQNTYDRWGDPRREWTLCMPMMPLDVRVARWKGDLIGAYTVHELLHALWTDWDVVKQTRAAGLHGLCNALEDCRIEARATRGDLVLVNEARRLLMALNAHIAQRALKSPNFALDDASQFSFVLGLVIFAEKLGYVSELPVDWKARVRPEWLPLFKLALDRFDALSSTADVLRLALDLKALAASLPKPKARPAKPNAPQGGEGVESEREGGKPGPTPEGVREREITEPEPEDDDDTPEDDSTEDMFEPPMPPRPIAGLEDDLANAPEPVEPGASDSAKSDGEPSQSPPVNAGDQGGRGGARAEPEPEAEQPAEDLTDATQVYAEANLNDLSEEAAKDAGQPLCNVQSDCMHAATILNVPLPRRAECKGGGNPKIATAAIESPAKLRRHLTAAVKSPERVAVDRRQVSGRLDMRNLVGLSIGSPNVFKRRVEEEGREAAVTLSIDVSGSMAGDRLRAAKALALHMGDALKAAGVKFEICAWDDIVEVIPKPFAKGWSVETQRAVAGLKTMSGTGMLPAMKAAAERLLKVGNVTRRILLVMTDGADSYAMEANSALCKFYAARGVEIVGIGLQTHGIKGPFNGRAIEVWDTRQLSEKGLGELVKALDAGAARTA